MSPQSGSLTDIGFGPGKTQNFQVEYDSSLYNNLSAAQQAVVKANLIANANFLLGVVEGAFTTTTGWFGTPASKFGPSNRQLVLLNRNDGSGANNTGYGGPINLDGQGNNANVSNAGPIVAMVWMNEWSEVLMSLTSGQWNAGDSSGEGLSQFSGIELFQSGHYSYYGSWVDQWLNGVAGSPNAARSDWVNQTFTGSGAVRGDGDSVSFGCALAFIFYLNVQLGFSINQIIAAYSHTMAGAYKGLTDDSADPFPPFLNLIQSVFPASQTANIPGPVSDNPFPIALVSFWAQKDTFGKDEAKDIIDTQGGLVASAFSVAIEGFSKQSFQALGITVAGFGGTFASLPGVTISASPLGPQFESGVNDVTPQRILIPFDITLGSPILNQFPATGTASYTLTTSLDAGGNAVSGPQAATEFELIAGADPYFTNVNTSLSNLPYLSQDLRVFTATPALNSIPIPGGPTLTDSIPGAYTYIKALLGHLNSSSGFTNPNGVDPFTTIFPDQGGANQGDSSVTPVTVDFSQGIFNPRIDNNYNFAIARVRLRGPSGSTGAAKNVRVFFRLWGTQSNDTDYDLNSTYPSAPDSAGKPGSPLVGTGNSTIPMFATNNFGSQTDYVAGGPNIQTLTIPNNQDSLWWYFGCFLNVYDPANIINGNQVQTYLAGTHHCLVAQIAYDGAPIPSGMSPLSWDQLAQRNLQVTLSDNPGPPATHRIPQTFDCRPSATVTPPGTGPTVYPDELMIDWGEVPTGSVASLYWPQVLASDVVALADQFYSTNPLGTADAHTITIPVTQHCVSYVPIPVGAGQNFAGLFTIDLPQSVVAGQTYDVVVRRIGTHMVKPPPAPPPPPPPPQTQAESAQAGDAGAEQTAHDGSASGAYRNLQPETEPGQTDSERAGAEDGPPDTGSPPSTLAQAVAEPTASVGELAVAVPLKTVSWRYVVGTFQVRIPVATGSQILPSEEVTLAIMKWRFQQMSPSSRWYPVLVRYIEYISARVDGLGGDASSIPPSLSGVPPGVLTGPDREQEFTGKICEVIFDCRGEFEGFVLDDCGETRHFHSRERDIGRLVVQACRQQMTLSVVVDRSRNDRIRRLVIRR